LIPAAILASSVITGCAKLVPSSVDDFSAATEMVITLRDGETITGRFEEGEKVKYVTFGRVYRATIEEIGPADIILGDAYVQEEYDAYRVQRTRMEGAELYRRDGKTRIRIPRYKIVDVQEVTFDKMKSARATIFWGFTTFVLTRILSARL